MPNEYDRIFKEVFAALVPDLIHRYLGLEVIPGEEMPRELTGTYEKRVDFLLKAQEADGSEVLLHFEFQSRNDPRMVDRMAQYYGQLRRKYGLPVRHFVVYAGRNRPTMRTRLSASERFEGFTLIDLHALDVDFYLGSGQPATILMGIFADFQDHPPEVVVERLVRSLELASRTPREAATYVKRLLKLSRILKLEEVVYKKLNEMPITFNIDIRETFPYQKGVEEGKAQGVQEGKTAQLLDLVRKGLLSPEVAAAELGVDRSEFERMLREQ